MFNIIKTSLPVILLSVAAFTVSAQRDTTINREVEVVKSFQPTLQDANKIYDMPKIDEVEIQKPGFNYNINSQPVSNAFAVNPLKAASIGSNPKTETGYGLVKAGVGNYNKPYGELFFNHLTSKKSIFGIHAMHLSSHGKLELEGGDKVDAPFSKNLAEVYFNQFFRESVLSVNVNYNRDAFNYYGYPVKPVPEPLMKENQTINYFGTKQAFSKGGISVKLSNPSIEITDPYFGFDFDYHYFTTKTGQNENYGKLMAHIQQPFSFATGLLDIGFTYNRADNVLNRATQTIDSRVQSWMFINPAIYFDKKMFNAELGINAWYVTDKDVDAQFRITPNILLNFMPVKNVFKVFAGIDGNFINNHYSKIAYENPFVNPEHDVINSFEKIRFYGGFDGKFAAKTNFKIGVDYSLVDDQPFYYLEEYTYPDPNINPNPQIVDNDFSVLYDDLSLFKINLEIFHRSSGKLDLMLSGNYFMYNMNEQTAAWNMPDWDATFNVGYKITEQLSVSADFYLIGARKALIINTPLADYTFPGGLKTVPEYKSFNLDTAFDMNVRGNYKITEKFSVFAQLNNFGFQKYQRWFGYPVQSFNFLAGVSYSF
ncbi:MAG: hypothetical protein EP310_09655 [Bacteroidetes bacterium]|nr:MAG: hypothetical protein EP310_09655 [Bacteroidota bacterium]